MNSVHHIHLVSDSTGETTYSLARACLVQFENLEVQTHTHVQVRNEEKLIRVLESVEANPGAVIFTILNKDLAALLAQKCAAAGIPCINVLDGVITHLERFFGQNIRRQPGRQHQMDAGYFERIEAMHFTLDADDGQRVDRLGEAEIVLVGISRTSKTPTSIYLANHRGLKVANVPFVPGVPLPDEVFDGRHHFTVGLTTSADRLLSIRQQRMKAMGDDGQTDYVDPEKIKAEIIEARRLFTKMGWPVIDVTRRSIEETASEIISHYDNWLDQSGKNQASEQQTIFS